MTDRIEQPKAEMLRSLVKAHVIENFTPTGYGEFDFNGPLFRILGYVDNQTLFSKDAKDNEATVIVLSPKNITGDVGLQDAIAKSRFAPNDVLVCFSLRFNNTDSDKRPIRLRGLMTLSLQDINSLTNEMQKDPSFLF